MIISQMHKQGLCNITELVRCLPKAFSSSRLSRLYDDLNIIAMIGTSDRLCWLAEALKILLLLLLLLLLLQLQLQLEQADQRHTPPSTSTAELTVADRSLWLFAELSTTS